MSEARSRTVAVGAQSLPAVRVEVQAPQVPEGGAVRFPAAEQVRGATVGVHGERVVLTSTWVRADLVDPGPREWRGAGARGRGRA